MYAIIVHGGAGVRKIPKDIQEQREKVLRKSCETGAEVLARGGNALDAVEEAVKILEDSPLFNAGTGSALTLTSEIEMDAAIMDGSTLKAGAVACIKNVKNPISVARKVMEKTSHVLLVGEGAILFARKMGFEEYNPRTDYRVRQLKKYFREWLEGKIDFYRENLEVARLYVRELGTVGAIALDKNGNIAAGASTGGFVLKLPGRVGDTPIIGAGIYATNAGAAVATGLGEAIIKFCLSFRIVSMIENGLLPQEACKKALEELTQKFGENTAGVIALDKFGSLGYCFNTLGMDVVYKRQS
ncbi:asparaginase [archaeon]|nr:MAG: asparaginase [archaeon]